MTSSIRLKINVLLIAALLSAFACGPRAPSRAHRAVPPELAVQWRFRSYTIDGSTIEQLRASMSERGPRGDDGKRYPAFTRGKARWNATGIQDGDVCRYVDITVTVTIVETLPVWSHDASGDGPVRDAWTKELRSIRTHEEMHAYIAISSGVDILRMISSLTARDCTELSQLLDLKAKEIFARHRDIEKEIDRSRGQTEE